MIYEQRLATLLTEENTNRYLTFRTYRAEKTYAVSSGKWLVAMVFVCNFKFTSDFFLQGILNLKF